MNRKSFLFGCLTIVSAALLHSCNKFDHQFPHWKGKAKPDIVYIMSNEAGQNKILSYEQRPSGKLEFLHATNTGGVGSGAGLGSQGSVIIDESGKWLYTVNAGDNTISAFRISNDQELSLYQTVNSGGTMPVSLAVFGSLLYVVNGGGNICGFHISGEGMLEKISGSDKPLSKPDAGPAQISFMPGGKVLAVTEKNTNAITTYLVDDTGKAGDPKTFDAQAETPFGFAFTFQNKLIV